MQALKILTLAVLTIIVLGFLHYTLPGRDVVRLVGTDVKRMDVGRYAVFWANPDAGTNQNFTRDVRFINAVTPSGKAKVYRNEDTDWSWPPYLKFDSGNLSAEVQNLTQQRDTWVAVTHYGWRVKLFSIFPNAVKIRQVEGPNVFLIPWFNIAILGLLAVILFVVVRKFRQFKRRRITPVTDHISDVAESIGDYGDSVQHSINTKRAGISGWFRRWFGTTKPR
ncbi:hypothetical protein GCM10008927_05400 [Amylibacter ulvae]|uniref:DUF1523 domain-containing protein n=1 Tax=Paramylibacter ulvae TaxID=1651968 RepID=A0ABQ3CTV3_9RHOB|nr:DUF1523 family protein [Amylibacter ulvae]GHA43601.1 hypothetical protein GCM10008927_05400 [Amylibacter ulvae]